MIDADNGCNPDAGISNRRIFEVDRADPLAARLDDVLRAIGQPEKAKAVNRADVAGVEPAIAADAFNIGKIAVDDPQLASIS